MRHVGQALIVGVGVDRGHEALFDTEALIQDLGIPDPEKKRLLAMTPASYIGKAAELAKKV